MKSLASLSCCACLICGVVIAAPNAPVRLQRPNQAIQVQGFGGGSIDTGGFSRDDINVENLNSAIDQGIAAAKNYDGDITADIKAFVDNLQDNGDFCERVGAEARIDCLADRYAETARSLSNRGPEKELKKAFRTAAKKMRRVVSKNVDRRAPKIALKGARVASSRPLRQIKADNIRRANGQARAIIEELETVILRSQGSKDRNAKYAQIARAVASDKLLLRS